MTDVIYDEIGACIDGWTDLSAVDWLFQINSLPVKGGPAPVQDQLLLIMPPVQVVVVGAGVVGLSTAVCISEALPSCSVSLVADAFSPDITSDGAAGIVLPAEFPGGVYSRGNIIPC